ncbi:sulfatase-like hydrolase/transferase [Dawidia soli]|uniref:Sulfatase-like hydrolase/transferase n=1 Tax=Dawidia soli TaxID=2782352 RepID=A0AAP2DCZ4_9BACT|nr:sulfatase-like hydrolase/transferase [Dawidia soli]MBT1688510.1 sulfatase-like hydrolase/transferase [Dawidia soli]
MESFFTISSFAINRVLAVLLIAGYGSYAQAIAQPAPSKTENNLLLADPHIFFHDGLYYLYGTRSPDGFEVFTSRDLQNWEGPAGRKDGFALKRGDAFGTSRFWAPQVVFHGGKFYMAYTANTQIAIATGSSPLGPFTQSTPAALPAQVKEIDPFIFMDDDGKKYLYYVRVTDGGNRIFVAEMTDDLLAIKPQTLTECIRATAPWENTAGDKWTVTEGPTVLKHERLYYLLYSANDFKNPNYAVGYATSKSPFGPWEKYNGNPILSKNTAGVNGTGHGDVVPDGQGGMFYVFHTHSSSTAVGPRRTALARMTFTHDAAGPDRLEIDGANFRFLEKKQAVQQQPAGKASRPNVIFILADDLGYSELGCYGNTFNETPHLDKLAAQGVRFTNAYASAPVCSPYRAALMTGQYPARVGITDYLRPNAADHLDTAYVTLAEMFLKNGYQTGIVGKWHLSGYRNHRAPEETLPDKHGFAEVMISENRGIADGTYFHPYHFNREIEKKLPGAYEFLTDRENVEAVEFIERNKEKPFFLFLSHYAVHTQVHGKPELVAHFRKKAGAGTSAPGKNNSENDPYKKFPADYRAEKNNPHLAAQLYSIDEGVGMIMAQLQSLGLAENTIVIFTSDNGGEVNVTSNAPLRGGKSMLYEGGVREPLIVWNPTRFAQGSVVHEPIVNFDFYPTLLEGTGAKHRGQKLDGISLASVLRAPGGSLPARSFYWHYPLVEPHFLGGRSAGSIRKGDWKLIEFFDKNEVQLFNLKNDPGEQRDLSKAQAAKVTELKQELAAWRTSVGAKIKIN